jgi:hypothetical protein
MFLRSHLNGQYEWPQNENQSLFKGSPTRRSFDRYNGNQVLYMINLYSAIADKSTLNECRKMESMLQHHLPIEMKSEISVFNWLRDYFDKVYIAF